MRTYPVSDKSKMSREAILALTRPQHQRIMECIDHGWEFWRRLEHDQPEYRRPIDKTSRANLVYNYITDRAARVFRSVSGTRWIAPPKSRVRILSIRDTVHVKFKKLDPRLRASGISTNSFELFQNQGEFFPELNGVNLFAGYVLDVSESIISGKYLVCPSGDNILWAEELRASSARLRVEDTNEHQRIIRHGLEDEGMAAAQ